MEEAKGGTEHKGAIRAIFRRLHRYEVVQREIFGNKDFKLDLETFGSEGLLNYMRYVEQEYTLYIRYPKVLAQFELYQSTMRPSSKSSAQSGELPTKGILELVRQERIYERPYIPRRFHSQVCLWRCLLPAARRTKQSDRLAAIESSLNGVKSHMPDVEKIPNSTQLKEIVSTIVADKLKSLPQPKAEAPKGAVDVEAIADAVKNKLNNNFKFINWLVKAQNNDIAGLMHLHNRMRAYALLAFGKKRVTHGICGSPVCLFG